MHPSTGSTNQEVETNATEPSPSENGALLQSGRQFPAGNTVPLDDERSPDAAELHWAKDRALVHAAGELRQRRRLAAGPGRRCVVEDTRGLVASPSMKMVRLDYVTQ